MPDGKNELQWETGTLTIDVINRHFVSGRIEGVAHHREYSEATKKKEITETRTLAAKFGLRVRGVLGKYRDMGYVCIDRSAE